MRIARSARRILWLLLAVLCIALYVGLASGFGLGNPFNFIGGTQLRAFLPVLAFFAVVGDLLRIVPVKKEEKREEVRDEGQGQPLNSASGAATPPVGGTGTARPAVVRHDEEAVVRSPAPAPDANAAADRTATGEALFIKARNVPHQEIPDYEVDGLYLDMLGESAEAGYGPAAAKLGEYALRRAAWIEAYYWMSMARRAGMLNLQGVMREIRTNWARDEFPDESENVSPIFSHEAGSIGRALLHVDSGYEAAKAREFLRAYYPEFVSSSGD